MRIGGKRSGGIIWQRSPTLLSVLLAREIQVHVISLRVDKSVLACSLLSVYDFQLSVPTRQFLTRMTGIGPLSQNQLHDEAKGSLGVRRGREFPNSTQTGTFQVKFFPTVENTNLLIQFQYDEEQ